MSEIGLMDCNNFFASCEQLLNPELIGKPLCVMSGNDGCVIARSKEAKELGISMGAPVFMAKKEFPGAVYVSGRLGVYGEISARVMSVLSQFTPVYEVYSIDEAFFDLTGLRKLYDSTYEEIGLLIKNAVMEQVGIPVSIGISKTKTLAKLATDRAKNSNGVFRISTDGIEAELKKTKVIDIWGIGKSTALTLDRHAIKMAHQFTSQSNAWIKSNLGQKGLELKEELLGNNIYPISTTIELPKSIQKTSSFEKSTNDYDSIKNSLNYHTHRACSKLRRLGMKTKVVGIMLRTKDFRVVYNKVNLTFPTNCEFEIYKHIDNLLKQLYFSRTTYRSSGVIFESLTHESEEQMSLFGQSQRTIKRGKVSQVWDKLENRFGRNIIMSGFYLKRT